MKGRGDPQRLRRASDAPPELARALELWRSELPTPEELERIAESIEPELSAGGSEVSRVRTPRIAAPLRPVAAGATLAFKLLLAAAVAAVGAGAFYQLSHSVAEERAEPPSPIAASPTRTPSVSAESSAVATVAAGPSPPAEAKKQIVARVGEKERAATATSATPRAASGSEAIGGVAFPDASNAAEAALVERAERALSSDPATALRLAGEHASRFPNGILTQEREFLAIQALLGLGRRTDAVAHTARFRARFPDSVHLRRLDLLLGAARDDAPP